MSKWALVLIGHLLGILGLTAVSSCTEAKYVNGKRTYEAFCASCHMEDGSGVEDLYPSLIDNPTIAELNSLVCIIRYGKNEPSSLIKMPPNPNLKAVDITNIINYIRVDLNGDKEELLMKTVTESLQECKD